MIPLEQYPMAAEHGCWTRIGVNGDGSCPLLKIHTHCRNCPVFSNAGQALYDRPPPAGYADEWAERIANADSPPADASIAVVLFKVGREWLALDANCTVEVAPARTIRRVPHQTDRVFAGLVNIRGELQLSISLRHLLGIEETPKSEPVDPNRQRLLLAERHGVRWVFLTDSVDDIHHFPVAALGRLPVTVASSPSVYTRGVFRWKDVAVGYLDADRIFAALKRSFR